MNKRALYLILMYAALQFASCRDHTTGSGKPITKTYTLQSFDGVLSDLAADVHIICDSSKSAGCSITADDNIIGLLKVEVAKGELILTSNGAAPYTTATPISVTVTMPTIASAKLLGSGDLEIDGAPVNKEMNLGCMGSGNMKLSNGTFTTLSANLSGSGSIAIENCICLHSNYGIKGSGSISAYGNMCKEVAVNLTGSGKVTASAANSIDISLKGSGTVQYKGNPSKVVEHKEGSGHIEQL
jgi:hypothetical protein